MRLFIYSIVLYMLCFLLCPVQLSNFCDLYKPRWHSDARLRLDRRQHRRLRSVVALGTANIKRGRRRRRHRLLMLLILQHRQMLQRFHILRLLVLLMRRLLHNARRQLGGTAEQHRVLVVAALVAILQRTLHVTLARLLARLALHFQLLGQ